MSVNPSPGMTWAASASGIRTDYRLTGNSAVSTIGRSPSSTTP
jgi:hypothetical protein